ncbi:hypothetical protein [Actinocorallia aurantiaca]|uniref:hypothetical protein n=1 Tax=Actinocorallia aurantiaca TaxID=46204 RepID=UPI0031D69467
MFCRLLQVGTRAVITYDRRGLSRGALEDPGRGVTMAEYADDVHACSPRCWG